MAIRKINVRLVSFVLRRIRQLGLREPRPILLDNLRKLYPVFRETIGAIVSQSGLEAWEYAVLGGRLLDLFDDVVVGHLEYHRDWILTPFAQEPLWNQVERLDRLYETYSDTFTRRGLILGLGRAKASHWFRHRKLEIFEMPDWERRAFIFAASCLPGDEARYWYSSIMTRLDPLEQAVVAYAKRYSM